MGPASENAGYAFMRSLMSSSEITLQWVQRPRTLVMNQTEVANNEHAGASMGPASENAGYGSSSSSDIAFPQASMGPASENAGYDGDISCPRTRNFTLQWVQRPRTLVMTMSVWVHAPSEPASMGPASENAGYGEPKPQAPSAR